MSLPTRHDPEDVLMHLAWVQRLALRLCGDPALAEDVSQEALLAAFRSPPARQTPLRSWLGGVVRNQLRMTKRGAARREGYESVAAKPEAQPSADELVERISVQRKVVDEVLALPEAYRNVLLQRYFDEMTPKRIAEVDELSPATVKTRLRRALGLLRERLADDPETEAKGGVIATLWPLAEMEAKRLSAAPPTLPVGEAITASVSAGQVAAAVVALGVAGATGLFLLRENRDMDQTTIEATTASATHSRMAEKPSPTVPALDAERPAGVRTGSTATPAGAKSPQEAQDPPYAEVLVVDLAADPVAGVEVLVAGESPSATVSLGRSAADGRLEYIPPSDLGAGATLDVGTGPWVAVVRGAVFPIPGEGVSTLVVARPRIVSGRVLDPDGQPIVGATVAYASPVDLRTQVDIPLDRASRRHWTEATDAGGHFVLHHVPNLSTASLWVAAYGFEELEVTIEPVGAFDADFTLEPLGPDSNWFSGVVLDDQGIPAPGASVSLGFYAVVVDASGRFQLPKQGTADTSTLVAIRPGHQPVRIERPADGWPPKVPVRLGGAPLGIEGTVVDHSGRALSGLRIALMDSTFFGFLPAADPGQRTYRTVESISGAGTGSTRTGNDGTFRLTGLTPKTYRLLLHDPVTNQVFKTRPLEAGSRGQQIVFPTVTGLGSVKGRVVDEAGDPVPDAEVSLFRTVDTGAERFSERALQGPRTRTSADGSFLLDSVLLEGAELHAFAGRDHAPWRGALADFSDSLNVRILLPSTGAFFLDLSTDPTRVDSFTVEDGSGTELPLGQVERTQAFTQQTGHLEFGRSPVFRVSVHASWVVLRKQGRLVERIPIRIESGATQRVDY